MLLSLLAMSNIAVVCPVYKACANVLLRDIKAKQVASVSSVPRNPFGSCTDDIRKIACLYERGGCGASNMWMTSAGAEIEDNAEKIRDAGMPIQAPME
jgi:hypothetical protein